MPDSGSVEIKVNLGGSFADARTRLELTGGKDGDLYFLDDLSPGLPESLPLLHNGIELRIRTKGDQGDVTVKLRPCRRSQVRRHWIEALADRHDGSDLELKAEQDWSGQRRTLAISATSQTSSDKNATAIARDHPSSLFDSEQLRFLDDCGSIVINPEQLTLLGPIKITRWKEIPFSEFTLNAERWRLAELDVLELSIISPLDEARDRQATFLTAITEAELTLRTEQRNKTETFLAALAETAAPR